MTTRILIALCILSCGLRATIASPEQTGKLWKEVVVARVSTNYFRWPKDKQELLIDILTGIKLKSDSIPSVQLGKNLDAALSLAAPNEPPTDDIDYQVAYETLRWCVADHNARNSLAKADETELEHQLDGLVKKLRVMLQRKLATSGEMIANNVTDSFEHKIRLIASNPFLPGFKRPLTENESKALLDMISNGLDQMQKLQEMQGKIGEAVSLSTGSGLVEWASGCDIFAVYATVSDDTKLKELRQEQLDASKKWQEKQHKEFEQHISQTFVQASMKPELRNIELTMFVIRPVFSLLMSLNEQTSTAPPVFDLSSLPPDVQRSLVAECRPSNQVSSIQAVGEVSIALPPDLPRYEAPQGISVTMDYQVERSGRGRATVVSRVGIEHAFSKNIFADLFRYRTGMSYILGKDAFMLKKTQIQYVSPLAESVEIDGLKSGLSSLGDLPDLRRYIHAMVVLSDGKSFHAKVTKVADGEDAGEKLYTIVAESEKLIKPYEPCQIRAYRLMVSSTHGVLVKEALGTNDQPVIKSVYTRDTTDKSRLRVEVTTTIIGGEVPVLTNAAMKRGNSPPTTIQVQGTLDQPKRTIKELYVEEKGLLLPKNFTMLEGESNQLIRIDFSDYKLGISIPETAFEIPTNNSTLK